MTCPSDMALDAFGGGGFPYRLKKRKYDDWDSRLIDVNDVIFYVASG